MVGKSTEAQLLIKDQDEPAPDRLDQSKRKPREETLNLTREEDLREKPTAHGPTSKSKKLKTNEKRGCPPFGAP